MKLLVVAPSRVGGRIFSKWLSMELNLYWIHEPFHYHSESEIKTFDDLKKTLEKDNIVVKVNYGDWEKNYYDYDFYNIFDKIICLTRENIFDSAISYTLALKTKNFTKSYILENNWVENNFTEIKSNENYLRESNDKTKEIKDSLQIIYENVFINQIDLDKIVNYLDMGELKHKNLLDNNLKYRKEKIL